MISFSDLSLSQFQITYTGIEQSLARSFDVQTIVSDSISATKELKRIENQLIASGYLTANMESAIYNEASAKSGRTVAEAYLSALMRLLL